MEQEEAGHAISEGDSSQPGPRRSKRNQKGKGKQVARPTPKEAAWAAQEPLFLPDPDEDDNLPDFDYPVGDLSTTVPQASSYHVSSRQPCIVSPATAVTPQHPSPMTTATSSARPQDPSPSHIPSQTTTEERSLATSPQMSEDHLHSQQAMDVTQSPPYVAQSPHPMDVVPQSPSGMDMVPRSASDMDVVPQSPSLMELISRGHSALPDPDPLVLAHSSQDDATTHGHEELLAATSATIAAFTSHLSNVIIYKSSTAREDAATIARASPEASSRSAEMAGSSTVVGTSASATIPSQFDFTYRIPILSEGADAAQFQQLGDAFKLKLSNMEAIGNRVVADMHDLAMYAEEMSRAQEESRVDFEGTMSALLHMKSLMSKEFPSTGEDRS